MMNRKEAITKLGLSLGFLSTAPLFLSFERPISSLANTESYSATFFTANEFEAVKKIMDGILPKTEDSPSATEVGTHNFADKYFEEVISLEEQELLKSYLTPLVNKLSSSAPEDVLADAFDITSEQEMDYMKQIDDYANAMEENPTSESSLSDDVAIYGVLLYIREITIEGYKTSQYVGEEILAYDPIPSAQKGCIDLEEATGGKAWSLS